MPVATAGQNAGAIDTLRPSRYRTHQRQGIEPKLRGDRIPDPDRGPALVRVNDAGQLVHLRKRESPVTPPRVTVGARRSSGRTIVIAAMLLLPGDNDLVEPRWPGLFAILKRRTDQCDAKFELPRYSSECQRLERFTAGLVALPP